MNDNETIVCRCEEVSYGQLKEAIENGACTSQELKMATRAGMGMCQGRVCRFPLETMVFEQEEGMQSAASKLTVHSPVRPLPLSMVIGKGRGE
ncbi:(2Fe-2S)-binding protein [Bacillus songklensis]|uniref:(2Fe-2S)-binding protein n=1 Tax=Bacillus songklensis TaxID=1069116 RepID=A0ABV8B900_9BACI